ncbi:MAG: RagB/SusD family nutrient uptake outer membrane protein [Bacteroidales bacterium]
MKNKKIYYPIVFIIIFFFSGCNVLDDEPVGVLSAEGYLTSEVQALEYVNAAYDMLTKRHTTHRTLYLACDIKSDDSWNRESRGFRDYSTMADNETVALAWEYYYEAVRRCNRVIHGVADLSDEQIAPALRERIVAEGKFLRAHYYFTMHQLWYNVPLVLEVLPANAEALEIGQSSIEDFWAQIEKDLTEAAQVLPARSEYPAPEYGRATRGAANSLKAIVHLYQEEWQQAYDLANTVITSGEYELSPVFLDAFNVDENPETVWSWRATDGGLVSGDQAAFGMTRWETSEGTEVPVWSRSRPFGGWMLRGITQDLVDEFEDGDPRKKYTVAAPGDTIEGQVVGLDGYQSETGPLGNPLYGPRKLYYEGGWEPTTHKRNAGRDWPIIRLAEVYLVRAEASIRLNNLGGARDDINAVRGRADVQVTPVGDFASQEEALEALIHERRVELATNKSGSSTWYVGDLRMMSFQIWDSILTRMNIFPSLRHRLT